MSRMNRIDLENAGFNTKAIHAGQTPDPVYGALATPIYQTSTFCFDSVEQGAARFAKAEPGYVYSRGGNPTVRALEEKMALIEGGEDCVATASGMGAGGSVMLTMLKTGDELLAGDCVYGGTSAVLRNTLANFGVKVRFVDTSDLNAVAAAITDQTKMIYFETPTNPMMKVTDIRGISELIRGRNIKLVVDNTFAPPPIQFPLREGADIVVHSVTKYLNGHGDVVGGVVIGSAADIANVKGNGVTKISGSTCSPFNAFLVLRGLQTLDLRVRRHCGNALKVAQYLETVPYVKQVNFPGLESSPYHELASRQMNQIYTGILSFELKDNLNGRSSFEAGKKVVNSLKLASIAVSLGDPASLVEHPASMTHASVPKEVREATGITDGLIRYSVGLEDVEDIIADLAQGFAQL